MTICDVVHWAYAHKAGMYPFLKCVKLLCLNDTLHKREDKKNEQKTIEQMKTEQKTTEQIVQSYLVQCAIRIFSIVS